MKLSGPFFCNLNLECAPDNLLLFVCNHAAVLVDTCVAVGSVQELITY